MMSDDGADQSLETTGTSLLHGAAIVFDVLGSPPLRATIVDAAKLPCKVDVNVAALVLSQGVAL